MAVPVHTDLALDLIDAATSFGASLAGLAAAADLEKTPSRAAWQGNAAFPAAGTILVLALVHSAANPALDWWDGPDGGTPGNRRLREVSQRVSDWLEASWKIPSRQLAYSPKKGGVFLKDAAVLAGLGTIGRNNLLITPGFGPRVRLRALLVDAGLPSTGPLPYSPCDNCDSPCFQACERNVFAAQAYCRKECLAKVTEDESASFLSAKSEGRLAVITYCRKCELSCTVGGGISN